MMDRRSFLKGAAVLSAAYVLPRFSFAAESGNPNSGRVRVACVGCGGRGTGAVRDLINADKNVQIVALGDLFEDRLKSADSDIANFVKELRAKDSKIAEDLYAVTPETMFSGFDCCKKVLEVPCDMVILAAPPCFRTEHLELCLNAGKHVFAEKPLFVDITQARKVEQLAKLADERKLSVVVGFQRHYDEAYKEGVARLMDGQIGDIVAAQCYWLQGGYVGSGISNGHLPIDTQEYQIRNWAAWIWTSGDHIVEQHCHNIDVVNWCLNGKLPKNIMGMGGRGVNQEGELALPYPQFGDRYSHFTVDFDYGDGVRVMSLCRQEPRTAGNVSERIVGTKGILTFDGGAQIVGEKPWSFSGARPGPYVQEHAFLLKNIRDSKHVNAMHLSIVSNLLALAGRESAFSGMAFSYEFFRQKSNQKLTPDVWDLKAKKAVGKVPVAGVYKLDLIS